MATRIVIDLNVRIGRDLTYSGYEDVEGCAPEKLPRDADIEVYEAESGVHGPARVISLDRQRQLVYLKLDWTKLSPPAEQELGT